jgi:uncharacterized protein (TIGR00725 family)
MDTDSEKHPRAPARNGHRTIIGVMGSAVCDKDTYAKARSLGHLLAEAGYAVLCGGRTGVMEAVARGASDAGGLTIGIMPGHDFTDSPPNPFIQVPIFTGISLARNVVNILSSRVVVAVAGGVGTLSEIALALKYGKPVVLLDSWRFEIPGFDEAGSVHRVQRPEEVVALVKRILEG